VIRGHDPKVSGGQVCHNKMRRESEQCDGWKVTWRQKEGSGGCMRWSRPAEEYVMGDRWREARGGRGRVYDMEVSGRHMVKGERMK
jgi:hypothetical protein